MKRTLWLMMMVAIVVGLAFSVGGCGKKKMTAEEEMGPPVTEEKAPQPGEPGYEKIYEEGMASKEESLHSVRAADPWRPGPDGHLQDCARTVSVHSRR